METKKLNDYIRRLSELEQKKEIRKNLLNSLRIQIEDNEEKINGLRIDFKTSRHRLDVLLPQIPIAGTDLIDVETENTTLSDQRLVFQTKISDWKRKIGEEHENQKKIIKTFTENAFEFSQKFGFGSDYVKQGQQSEQMCESLGRIEKELSDRLERICVKDSEDSVSMKNSLKDEINCLKEKINGIKKDNIELKLIENQQKDRFNSLECRIDCQEVNALKKQLDDIERKILEKKNEEIKRKSAIKCNDFEVMKSIENTKPKTIIISDPPIKGCLKHKEISDEEIKELDTEARTETETDKKSIWEMKRSRKKRRVTFDTITIE